MPESPPGTVSEAVDPGSVALPSSASPTPAASPPAGPSKAPKVAAASLIGTTIEYYDFAVYGTASALVLGPAFFPSGNATVSTLAAFLTFAAAFLSRPSASSSSARSATGWAAAAPWSPPCC